MSGATRWFYQSKGLIEDETQGPVAESEIVRLIVSGKINKNTLLASAEVTNNQWYPLQDVRFFDDAVSQERLRIDAERRAAAEKKEQEKASKRIEKQRAAEEKLKLQNLTRQEEARQRELQRQAHEQHLMSLKSFRRRYQIVLADSVEQASSVCNKMGYEGWELEQAFSDTFTYTMCCGNNTKRQFVLVFSQPLHPE